MIPSFLKFHFQFLQFLFCLFVIPKYLIYVLRVIFHPFCSLSIRFALDHYFRKACIALSENKKFEYFILVTILATCVSLGYIITISIIIFKFSHKSFESCHPSPTGMNTPYPNNDSDDTNKLLEEIEVKDSFSRTRLKFCKFQVIFMIIFILIFFR